MSTYTFGQTRKSAQPVQVQSSSSRTPRTGSRRRTSGDRNAPSTRHAPNEDDEQTDLAARQPLLLPDHDDREQHARARRSSRARREARSCAGTACPQRKRNPSASRERNGERSTSRSLLERRAHREQRTCREHVQHRVDEEREGAGDAEEHAAERGAGSADGALAAGDDGDRRRQLGVRHDGAKGARLGGREDRRARTLDERDERDHPVDELVGDDQHAEPSDRDRSHGVGRDHQPPAVPAVRRDPGGQREERHSEQPDERDDAGLRGRAREREDEQRIRDRRHLRARAREQQSGLEQEEVAIPAQRRRVGVTGRR